jgi:hypothetical protein
MPESAFRRAMKRKVASVLLRAGLSAVEDTLYNKKTFQEHSGNMVDAYACAVYYGNSLAYGDDGNACIAYANTKEEDVPIEIWNDYLGKSETVRGATGRGKRPPQTLQSHEKFYGHSPNGWGRDWAWNYAQEKANSFPHDDNFRIVIFNAAPYTNMVEQRGYQVITCVVSDAIHEINSVSRMLNEKMRINMRTINVSVNKQY